MSLKHRVNSGSNALVLSAVYNELNRFNLIYFNIFGIMGVHLGFLNLFTCARLIPQIVRKSRL